MQCEYVQPWATVEGQAVQLDVHLELTADRESGEVQRVTSCGITHQSHSKAERPATRDHSLQRGKSLWMCTYQATCMPYRTWARVGARDGWSTHRLYCGSHTKCPGTEQQENTEVCHLLSRVYMCVCVCVCVSVCVVCC